MPPFSTFGHDTFTSRADTPGAPSSLAARRAYSSTVSPAMLANTATPDSAREGSTSSTRASTPLFSRPIELSMPHGVSQMRGPGLPPRGFSVTDLRMMPPTAARSMTEESSAPYPAVPEASMTGFFSFTPARSTDRSMPTLSICLLYTSDAADDPRCVDLGG